MGRHGQRALRRVVHIAGERVTEAKGWPTNAQALGRSQNRISEEFCAPLFAGKSKIINPHCRPLRVVRTETLNSEAQHMWEEHLYEYGTRKA